MQAPTVESPIRIGSTQRSPPPQSPSPRQNDTQLPVVAPGASSMQIRPSAQGSVSPHVPSSGLHAVPSLRRPLGMHDHHAVSTSQHASPEQEPPSGLQFACPPPAAIVDAIHEAHTSTRVSFP